jgi:hypothetical protein
MRLEKMSNLVCRIVPVLGVKSMCISLFTRLVEL